jgi:hypothetical protein
MSRDIALATVEELSEKVIAPFFAVDLAFDSSPLYVWSGYGDLVIGSKTYLGAGQLLNISSVSETTEMEAKGATISMSGIPSSFLSLALQEPYQGRECRIYFGLVISSALKQENGSYLLAEDGSLLFTESNGINLTEIFAGELDQMNIEEQAESANISVTAENVLVKLERPVVRRFTNEDQKSRFPSDRGLEYVAALQDKEIFWGRVAKK